MTNPEIRNFSIIAHIDHGKSTLADRLLELTGTIPERQMRAQVLDSMELERERGITIKMQPVCMMYRHAGCDYILNLIDTPGHIDFAYEVSRALAAVEGVVLLIDAVKGIQAQTVSVLNMARALGRTIIPVLNKIDLPAAAVEENRQAVARLVGVAPNEVLAVSAKTGEGVVGVLTAVVERCPPAAIDGTGVQALVFDFEYSTHRGLIVYVRLLSGQIKAGDQLLFCSQGEKFTALEVGVFSPAPQAAPALAAGTIGYIVTGIKNASRRRVGDTVTTAAAPAPAVAGYAEPRPVAWASIYPSSQDDFTPLRQALERLALADSSLSFEEESSGALGRGFRAGFLGLLHLEIITERLRREFKLDLIISLPSISYQVMAPGAKEPEVIYSPHLFPAETKGYHIAEPWVEAEIITPPAIINAIVKIINDHEGLIMTTENFSADRNLLRVELPLRELMRSFFAELKTVSSGFASLSYQSLVADGGWRPAAVTRLDLLVAEELVPAFSRVVSLARVEAEAKVAVERLAEILPRQLFVVKIQARALGRIIASRTLTALKKDVTGYLYGGDITRKRKLWEKQKRGKKKLLSRGQVNIPAEVFLKMISSHQ